MWNDHIVILSPRRGCALIARPDPLYGRWLVRWWGFPAEGLSARRSLLGFDLAAAQASPADVSWLALRLEVALATDIPADAETVVDSPSPVPRRLARGGDEHEAAETVLASLEACLVEQWLRAGAPDLFDAVPGLRIFDAGGMCPFQAWGSWHGHPWYFRFRGFHASLDVSVTDPISTPYWSAEAFLPGDIIGVEDFEYAFTYLGRRLSRADFRFEFTGSDGSRVVPAPDLADAWLKVAPIASAGGSPWRLVRDDDRVWPDPAPQFTVTRTLPSTETTGRLSDSGAGGRY